MKNFEEFIKTQIVEQERRESSNLDQLLLELPIPTPDQTNIPNTSVEPTRGVVEFNIWD